MPTTFQPLLPEAFQAAATRYAQRTALEWRSTQVSYAHLADAASQVSTSLRSAGLPPGALVAVLLEHPISLITSLLGILQAGCAFAVLDPSYPEERLQRMLQAAPPQAVLLEASLVPTLQRLLADQPAPLPPVLLCEPAADQTGLPTTLRPWPSAAPASPQPDTPVRLDPDALCYIYFTSGSTGTPKAIAGRLSGLSHFIAWERRAFQVDATFRVSQLIPPSFDPFLRDVFVPLCSGATLCIPDSRETLLNPKALLHWLDQRQITLCHTVPTIFRALVNQHPDPASLPALQYLLIAGEPLFGADVKKWLDIFGERVQLVNLYGPTETTLAKFCYRIQSTDKARHLMPVGTPIEGASALILDEQRQPCPPGVLGEIYIQTPYRTLGYYRQPELTNAVFIPNPFSSDPEDLLYKTGDLGRVLEDGTFEVVGRTDHQVKVRGVRIELGEIEQRLRAHPLIQDAVVKDWDLAPGEKALCAYFVAEADLPGTDLRAFLSQVLPPTMLPSFFMRLDRLPLNPNGKIDRHALPPPETSERTADENYVPPTLIEHYKLLEIWEELLNVRPIGIRDNFALLGGHSLLAARMATRIEEVFGKKISLATVFAGPTIEEIAQALHHEEEEASRAPIVALQKGPSGHPFFYMHGAIEGGGFYSYRLARELGPEQSFYALQPYRLEGLRVPPTFEEMAATHLAAIRAIQPEGPYLLGGFCNGALIAAEMTRQLQAQGQQVSLLVLIDPGEPARAFRRLVRASIHRLGGWLGISQEHQLSMYLRVRHVYASILYTRGRLGLTLPSLSTLRQSTDHLREAWGSMYYWVMPGHIPAFEAGQLVYFWKDQAEGAKGRWGRLAREQKADSFTIPGTHLEWSEENIDALAQYVSRYLKPQPHSPQEIAQPQDGAATDVPNLLVNQAASR